MFKMIQRAKIMFLEAKDQEKLQKLAIVNETCEEILEIIFIFQYKIG